MLDARHRAAQLLWRLSARSSLGTYGSRIGMLFPQDGGTLQLTKACAETSTSSITLEWPHHACLPDNTLRLPLVLAMADEISTFGCMVPYDRHGRAGVSVALSACTTAAAPRVHPGQMVTFESRLVKAGRQLGFLHFTVSVDGVAAVHGRHTKFLSPPGALMRLVEWCGPALRGSDRWQRALARLIETRPPVQIVDTTPQRLLPGLQQTTESTLEYEMAATPSLGNCVGAFHGGAAGVLGESADAEGLGAGAPPARMLHVMLHSALPTRGGSIVARVQRGESQEGREAPSDGLTSSIAPSSAVSLHARPRSGGAQSDAAVEVLIWR